MLRLDKTLYTALSQNDRRQAAVVVRKYAPTVDLETLSAQVDAAVALDATVLAQIWTELERDHPTVAPALPRSAPAGAAAGPGTARATAAEAPTDPSTERDEEKERDDRSVMLEGEMRAFLRGRAEGSTFFAQLLWDDRTTASVQLEVVSAGREGYGTVRFFNAHTTVKEATFGWPLTEPGMYVTRVWAAPSAAAARLKTLALAPEAPTSFDPATWTRAIAGRESGSFAFAQLVSMLSTELGIPATEGIWKIYGSRTGPLDGKMQAPHAHERLSIGRNIETVFEDCLVTRDGIPYLTPKDRRLLDLQVLRLVTLNTLVTLSAEGREAFEALQVGTGPTLGPVYYAHLLKYPAKK